MIFDDEITSSAQFFTILDPIFSTQLCSTLLGGIESMVRALL
jgi:hypothetical protein